MKLPPDDRGPPSLKDQLAGTMFEGFERGMEASQASASARWTKAQQHQVDAAIRRAALRHPTFTTDEVYAELPPDFPITKGMAARLNLAARRGIIENTGQLRICKRGGGHDHGQRLAIWTSGNSLNG